MYVGLFGLGTTLWLLLLLRLEQRIASGKSPDTGHANPAHPASGPPPPAGPAAAASARRLLHAGQVLGVFLIAAHAVKGGVTGQSLGGDLVRVGAAAGIALTLVLGIGHLGIRLLLQARLPAEIARGNAAAGLAAGAHYAATAIITSRAVGGAELRDLGLSLGFFLLGQATLHGFITLFRALTTYDDAEQIHGENLAAALSYGGVSIAVAVIIARAVEGDFVSWAVSLKGYGGVLLFLLALYPVRQILVQAVLLGAPFTVRGGRLDTAIAAERDAGMGALEAATYVATALSVAYLA